MSSPPCYITLSADKARLAIRVTPPSEGSPATWVRVPFSDLGMEVLRRILVARDIASDARIGTDAAPVQSDIEALLTALASSTSPVNYVGKKKSLPEGMTFEELFEGMEELFK